MTFEEFRLAEPILRAVRAEGYSIPTPIQCKAVPHVMEGRDVLGCAQTGTGKTAAFALPILHRLAPSRPQAHRPFPATRALILAPTRELAAQIGDSFRTYGRHLPLRHAVIFGGVNQNPQARALKAGIDILVATPGRLLDLMQQGLVNLARVEVLVLDEADHMLDMGFIRDVRKIVAQVPRQRQTLLFSATMPAEIRALADAILTRPVHVQVAVNATPVEAIDQSVHFVDQRDKPAMLESFFNTNAVARALVFTRTKHGADRVARHLSQAGIRAEAIHGNKSQNARTRAMNSFKSSAPPVLVATDIAARGLDIDEISHIINYDLPNVPETYVHRIGRTARAGASGVAVSFCDSHERPMLQDIERLIRKPIPISSDQPGLPDQAQRSRASRPAPQRSAISRDHHRREQASAHLVPTNNPPSAATERVPCQSTSGDHSHGKPVGVGYRSRGRLKPRRGSVRRSGRVGRRR